MSLFRLSPTGDGTVFTQTTSTATAAVEGALAYDTVADLLKVCDGTTWVTVSGGGGSVSANSLDFTEFKDLMTLDASTDIAASGTNVLSITNTGTGNSFLVNDAASDATPFVIDAAGNVGIGTTSPIGQFTVGANGVLLDTNILPGWSSVWLNQSAPGGGNYALSGNSSHLKINRPSGDIYFTQGNGAAQMIIKAGGNVGIGTTSPTNLLSLDGNSARTIWMERHTTANTAGNNLTLQSGGATSAATDKNGGDLILSSGTATGTGSSKIQFQTAAAGTTGTTDRALATAMTILGNGNVGVGIAAPDAKFQVGAGSSNTPSTVAEIGSSASGASVNVLSLVNSAASAVNNGVTLAFHPSSAYSPTATIKNIVTNTAGPATDMVFNVYGAGGLSERLRIQGSTGNVGINASNPTATLQIGDQVANSSSSEILALNTSYTSNLAQKALTWRILSGITGQIDTRFDGTNVQMVFGHLYSNGSNSIDIMTISGSGNVGIGTTTPNQGKLEVKGGTVCVDTDSDDNATSCITNESDIRLKKNIEVIPHALDTLGKLRGVLFDWRWDEFPAIADYKALGRDAGVIAQEVEAAYPQGMGEELHGYKTVRYDRLVPLLIQSVKELKAANDNLKSQLDAMAASHEAEIEALRQEIRAK